MAKVAGKIPLKGIKSLEIAMRDTMEGMFDSAIYFAYRSSPDTVQILSIEAPKPVNFNHPTAQVIPVRACQKISDYLIQRELHLERLPCEP